MRNRFLDNLDFGLGRSEEPLKLRKKGTGTNVLDSSAFWYLISSSQLYRIPMTATRNEETEG